MKTKGCEGAAKRSSTSRRSCEVELTERRTATGTDAGQPKDGLTQLEYEMLSLPADEKTVRQDRFPLLLGITPAESGMLLNRARRLGLIERERFLAKDPAPWVWLTQLGARAAHMPRRLIYEPRVGQLSHIDAVVRTRIHYMRKTPKGLWVPEREIIRQHGRSERHLIDAMFEIPRKSGGPKRIALEVELTTKPRYRRVQIMRALCETEEYDEIHYLCATRTKMEITHTKEAVEAMGVKADHLRILDVPDLAGIA